MKLIQNTALEIVALVATGLLLPLVCLAAVHNAPSSQATEACATVAAAPVSSGVAIDLQTKDSKRI